MIKKLPLVLLAVLSLSTCTFAVTFLDDFEVVESASGLAHDGEYLWLGHLGDRGDELWKITDYDGDLVETIPSPADGCYGLAVNNSVIWYLNSQPTSRAYSIQRNGSVILQWDLPSEFMRGLAVGGGHMYCGSYYQPAGILFVLEPSTGDSLGFLSLPGDYPSAAVWQDSLLWIADSNSNLVIKIDPASGAVLDQFESPGGNPKGLAYDGQWLYLLDDGDSENHDVIYQIDPVVPVPIAHVEPQELHFGAVVVGQDSTIDVLVRNLGSGNLVIQDIQFVGNDIGFTYDIPDLPIALGVYESATFSLTFHPPGTGVYDSPYMYMTCNDLGHSYWEFPVYGIGGVNRQRFNYVTGEDPLNFGQVRISETDALAQRYLVFSNTGAPTLTIEEFHTTSDEFFITRELPFSVNGGHLDSIAIWWEPMEEGFVEEEITIISNDPDFPFFELGVTGVASSYIVNGGEIIWEYEIPDMGDGPYDGFFFNAELSDIVGVGYNSIFAMTGTGHIITLNANSWGSGQPIYVNSVMLPGEDEPGFNDRTGYLYTRRCATKMNDINNDGYNDVIVATGGDPMGEQLEAGIVVGISGYEGNTLWVFDTAVYGGGPVREIIPIPDFTGDDIEDIAIAVDENYLFAGPRCIILLNSVDGSPVWMSSAHGLFRTVACGEDVNMDGLPELIAGTSDGKLYGIDGATGYPIWLTEFEEEIRTITPVASVGGDETSDLVVTTGVGSFGIDLDNGEQIWDVEFINQTVAALNLGDAVGYGHDIVALSQSSGLVYGIDTQDGEELWTLNVTGAAHDIKYVQDLDGNGVPELAICTEFGRVAVLKADGTNVRWSYSETGQRRNMTSLAIVDDVEGNYSVEIVCCNLGGFIRMFSGGREASDAPEYNSGEMPEAYAISAYWPNPFNSSVRLQFESPALNELSVGIYDILGRQVDRLSVLPRAGVARTLWTPGQHISAGTYFVRIENAPSESARILYVK